MLFEGQSVTLNANAKGLGVLTYQWNRNGVPLAGATADTYTVPAAAPADNGAAFTVTVRNDGTPATSAPARLTVKAPLDLRFKLTGGAPFMGGAGGIMSNLMSRMTVSYGDALGTPLVLGSGIASMTPDLPVATWNFGMSYQGQGSSGMGVAYRTGLLDDMDADLAAQETGDRVVTSLDAEEGPYTLAYGMSVLSTTQRGQFLPMTRGSVAPGDLAILAAQEGAAGRVITAVSYLHGSVSYVSHGWSEAPGAIYETQVTMTDFNGLSAQAQALADAGFVITAFGAGHDSADGYVLVGTRLQGASAPRPLKVVTQSGFGPVAGTVQGLLGTDMAGFALVGHCWDLSSNVALAFYEQ
jgi:hypothetical protein